jgi:hypothetical protein
MTGGSVLISVKVFQTFGGRLDKACRIQEKMRASNVMPLTAQPEVAINLRRRKTKIKVNVQLIMI